MSWNSLCALGFHSAGDMLPPGDSGNEAMRPVITRENSLAPGVACSGPGKCPLALGVACSCPGKCSLAAALALVKCPSHLGVLIW